MAKEGSDFDEVNDAVDGTGEEEEEQAAEEEDNDMEEENEYTFRFENGMNPLDFVDNNDDSGLQPYERFERLEQQALADKKRKATEQCHSEGPPSKMARESDISGSKIAEIMEAMNYHGVRKRSRKPKKRGRRKGSKNKMDPKLERMLGDANLHYSRKHYDEAKDVLLEVIKLAPNVADSYHTLGLVWLYVELGDYQKAAVTYEQVHQLCYENVEPLKEAAKLYKKCGQVEHAVCILEDYLKSQLDGANASVVDLLCTILMETKAHDRALQYIKHAQAANAWEELPLNLKIKAGICHAHLGKMDMAQVLFNDLKPENASKHVDLVIEVADSLMGLEHYNPALNYYLMLEGNIGNENRNNTLLLLPDDCSAVKYSYSLVAKQDFVSALEILQDDVDARITLASLLLEEGKEDEAISLLSPPNDSDSGDANPEKSNRWWVNGRIKLKLCNIYRNRGTLGDFVDTIFPLVRESLDVSTLRQKGKSKRRLTKRDLVERVRMVDGPENDNVFRGFRPVAAPSDRLKASRAKKLLQKMAIEKEKRKAEALASGIDWLSDDSDDEPQIENREPPLCILRKYEEHHQLIIDLCKALASLQRYWEALEIINLSLRLAGTSLSTDKKEELRSLGAQMAYSTTDPKHGFDCVKYIVQQHPHSVAAWNCYYKVISRLENRDTRHYKFVRVIQGKFVDCVPPILISGHQFTIFSHHQDAARKYLEAYKLLPENPLVNLCVGTALINLALGFRLQNKHQCLVQGLAFLYNNLRICENSQESLYNIARAYHHVGLVTLAAVYYEKVIGIREKDCPIPKLPNENPDVIENHKPGYCDLRREAAYNLHLIYKKSGALDLARQVLKDHCTL
ncbi:hypothetical protein LR48_Vigan08g187800 [Vigna angularis]|uniref:General transcription factor 3C polypeptide 3 n=1 Tax=Phaseolus angularis TaxID=3914 RepID=A0A0L9V7L8_PHAAN|nr:hypothetical protein LR48_Vigan08g187800 [Vigna angularis]